MSSSENRHTNGTDGPQHCKKTKLPSEMELFDDVFPELVNTLVSKGLKNKETSDASQWLKQVLEYNVPHGKKNRGLIVVLAYRQLVSQPSDEDLHIARLLGWAIEVFQAFCLILDDIMDQSSTRRGRPCWYKNEGVGLTAINDGVFLESCIYQLLKHYVRDKPYYIHMMELFHETLQSTITGQCLDMTVSPPPGTVDFSRYTMDKYMAIVKWKTAVYSFYHPVATAMHMAGIHDDESHSYAKAILYKIGEYFQVQDDYLDCYGDPEVIGKVGTDIQENKCSWLVVTALQKATPEQLAVLQKNYGSTDPDKVQLVKCLYEQLQLKQAFEEYEEQSYQDISELIEHSSGKLPQAMFTAVVKKIYKRSK